MFMCGSCSYPHLHFTAHSYFRTGEVTAASYVPLWATDILTPTISAEATAAFASSEAAYNLSGILESLQHSQLLQVGGILTSTEQTGQQWDFPNSWPPLVFMVQQGLQKASKQSFQTSLSRDLAAKIALNISSLWLSTNYAGYVKTGYMFEKYNGMVYGGGGGGGEYIPQVGFGWTNGVALALLNETYDVLPPIPSTPNSPSDVARLSTGA